MKRFIRTLPAKIICFVLCIVTLAISVVSVIGAVLLIEGDFYTRSKSSVLKENIHGKLIDDAYDILYHTIDDKYPAYFHNDFTESTSLSRENTNIRYQFHSPDKSVVATNLENTLGTDSDRWEYVFLFRIVFEDDELQSINYIGDTAFMDDKDIYYLYVYLEDGLPVEDDYAVISKIIGIAYGLRYWIYAIGIFSFILSAACFITLMCVSARRTDSDELYPGLLNRVPIDLLIAAAVGVFVFCGILIVDVLYSGELLLTVMLTVLAVAASTTALGLCMSIAARIKQRTIFKNTVIWMVCKFLYKALKRIAKQVKKIGKSLAQLILSIPLIWRTVLGVIGVVLLDILILALAFEGEEFAVFLWLLKISALVFVALYAALFMRKLQKGGNALAKGDLSYQVDTSMMFWDFKQHGENLNSIADGMACAVEERLQSERMKAELITNVSHDIKTPLTSIINYSGLICEEPCESEKHKEYAQVLVRKSEHLKRLLDDLVEISKATTGNLEVDLLPCEAGVLLTQAAGEFEQRCKAANLQLITSQPEKSIRIMADSRRIWRVFENLMSNACKYSLTGSRVYLSLEQQGNEALFVFKNTSRTALNISPDELMERFVRGDTSRSTEGNGLGLSIARSLTELQNGRMDITIDGDLFKVTLRFPVI